MVIFRDSNKSFNLDRNLLKTITNYDFNVARSNPQDQQLIHQFGKEEKFDITQKERKNNNDISLIKLLKSPPIMASGISTSFSPQDPDKLCERIKLLQEKQAENI